MATCSTYFVTWIRLLIVLTATPRLISAANLWRHNWSPPDTTRISGLFIVTNNELNLKLFSCSLHQSLYTIRKHQAPQNISPYIISGNINPLSGNISPYIYIRKHQSIWKHQSLHLHQETSVGIFILISKHYFTLIPFALRIDRTQELSFISYRTL